MEFSTFKYEELSKVKKELFDTFLRALDTVCDKKVTAIKEKFYSTDDWLEESAEIQCPSFSVIPSGISTTINYCGKDVTDDSIEW